MDNRIDPSDVDAFVFLKALKARAKHPVLFERAFRELFGTPESRLDEKIGNSDPWAIYNYSIQDLAPRVPDEPCPLDPSWADGALRTFNW